MTTLKEKKYFSKVAELGCAVCRRLGSEGTPAEIHHPRIKVGMGQRSSNSGVIPLCPEHHRGSTGVHGLGRKAFAQLYGFSEQDLQADVSEQLPHTPYKEEPK